VDTEGNPLILNGVEMKHVVDGSLAVVPLSDEEMAQVRNVCRLLFTSITSLHIAPCVVVLLYLVHVSSLAHDISIWQSVFALVNKTSSDIFSDLNCACSDCREGEAESSQSPHGQALAIKVQAPPTPVPCQRERKGGPRHHPIGGYGQSTRRACIALGK